MTTALLAQPLTLCASRFRGWRANGWIHRPPNGGERFQTIFIGMNHLDLCTTGTKAFNGLVERSYTQGWNGWAQCKNKHLIEAGSDIRVVARIKAAVNVVITFEERRRPTPKSCCRHYRIYQFDSRVSVEGASLACFGVDADYHQSFFGPSLNG